MIKIYEANENIYYWNGIDKVPKDVVNVVIEDGVTEIGTEAFWSCYKLESVIIPNSVTEIDEAAFSDCLNLKSIEIPDNVTKIGEYAFAGCESLTSIKISDNVTEISGGTFWRCYKLENVIIPNSVTKIGRSVFWECAKLRSIEIPNVIRIEERTFCGCETLISVVIPDSVIEIDKAAFKYCRGLESIIIPDSVIEIGKEAFGQCENLTDVQILGNPKIAQDAFTGTLVESDLIARGYIKPSKPEAPKTEPVKTKSKTKIPTWNKIVKELKQEYEDGIDSFWEGTDAGSYLLYDVCADVERKLGVSLEQSDLILTVYNTDMDKVLADDIDTVNFDEDILQAAFNSKTKTEFMKKYAKMLREYMEEFAVDYSDEE